MSLRTTVVLGVALLGSTLAQAQADARGAKAFEACAACHTLKQDLNEVGPTLHGIVGRRAGEVDGFRYSPALKRSGITWSEKTLDAFIADPQGIVPGNRMPYSGMPDATERAALIRYLREAR